MYSFAYKKKITSEFLTLVSNKSLELNNENLEKEIKLFNFKKNLGFSGVIAISLLVTIRCDRLVRSFMNTPGRFLIAFVSISYLPFGSWCAVKLETTRKFSTRALECEDKILELSSTLRELKAEENLKSFSNHSNRPDEYQKNQNAKHHVMNQRHFTRFEDNESSSEADSIPKNQPFNFNLSTSSEYVSPSSKLGNQRKSEGFGFNDTDMELRDFFRNDDRDTDEEENHINR
ncbi:hypothetical protein SteCoe_22338 [Stentor coeruleus]|uniref:Uncharacterized protein n=1 Tax=Stentor coeruleus TaxID=5963 RepID=A0A1R2BMI7_9CILI|nr:hypothetical protein SteCoe_22338 [Stentor coeruleus]